ncbi:MAG: extracellular solute-binding protein [Treponema sp.]|jgi:raffinose/stachyose/melibiose transport system substrate-binding protein|nr:extracellular solute-binding protein [Treponema sp.]
MNKAKWFLMISAVLLSINGFVFAGGGNQSSGTGGSQIEIRVLNYFDMTAANATLEVEQVWDTFAKDNPDIRVIREDLFNDPYHNKMEAYAAAGQLPEVIYVWPSGRSTTLHTNRLLKDLSPLIKRDGLDKVYTTAALDPSAQVSNYLAMIPRAITSSHAFYINNEVLQAAGLTAAKTYDELKAQVPVLRSKGYETVIMPNQDAWVMQSCLFSMVAGRFCGEGWDQRILAGQAKFTDPDFVAALSFIKALYDDGVINRNSLTTGYGDGIGPFATNKSAYYIDGDWRVGAFITDQSTGQAVIPPNRQTNFTITVFPDIPGTKFNQSSSSILGTGWAISAAVPSGSAKEEAAWKLVKWLSGKEVVTQLLETGGITTPARNDIDLTKLTLEPLSIEASKLSTKYTRGTAVIDGSFVAEVHEPINEGLQAIGLGSQTPQQVAQAAQRAFDSWKAKQ